MAAIRNRHRTYIGLIERAERNLSISTVEQIAAGLEIPVAAIFEEIEGAHRQPVPTKTDDEAILDRYRCSHCVNPPNID